MARRRIYLDQAATSWPKPDAVYSAVDRFQRECGAAAGRGDYRSAIEARAIVDRLRARVSRLVGSQADPRQVVFTANGTQSLNLALHGWLRPGDHVVTTEAEHNSVLRPLRQLVDGGVISVDYLPIGSSGRVDPQAVEAAIGPSTRLVVLTHASNVTGAIQPIGEVGRICRARGVRFLVDAAQTLGHVPLDVEADCIDLLAAPGHKGLLGPLGTGVLWVRPGLERPLRPLMQGGTGSQSESEHQPEEMPDCLESGNLNGPGLAGLDAALEWLDSQGGPTALDARCAQLTADLIGGLARNEQVRLVGRVDPPYNAGVVSFVVEGYLPDEVAGTLDAAYGIEVRTGLHCAARMHAALGTLAGGGTVRASVGPFTTREQVIALLQAIEELTATELVDDPASP